MEANENENTGPKFGDVEKVVLRGKDIAIQAYNKKQEKPQINNLTIHLQEMEKEQQTKSKTSRRKETIKTRAEINARETKKPVEHNNETRDWLFENISKINKSVPRHIKKKR